MKPANIDYPLYKTEENFKALHETKNIRKYLKERDSSYITNAFYFTEEFVKKYIDDINEKIMTKILYEYSFSEDFLDRYTNKWTDNVWKIISERQNLSEKFIKKYFDRLHPVLLFKNNEINVSEDYLKYIEKKADERMKEEAGISSDTDVREIITIFDTFSVNKPPVTVTHLIAEKLTNNLKESYYIFYQPHTRNSVRKEYEGKIYPYLYEAWETEARETFDKKLEELNPGEWEELADVLFISKRLYQKFKSDAWFALSKDEDFWELMDKEDRIDFIKKEKLFIDFDELAQNVFLTPEETGLIFSMLEKKEISFNHNFLVNQLTVENDLMPLDFLKKQYENNTLLEDEITECTNGIVYIDFFHPEDVVDIWKKQKNIDPEDMLYSEYGILEEKLTKYFKYSVDYDLEKAVKIKPLIDFLLNKLKESYPTFEISDRSFLKTINKVFAKKNIENYAKSLKKNNVSEHLIKNVLVDLLETEKTVENFVEEIKKKERGEIDR